MHTQKSRYLPNPYIWKTGISTASLPPHLTVQQNSVFKNAIQRAVQYIIRQYGTSQEQNDIDVYVGSSGAVFTLWKLGGEHESEAKSLCRSMLEQLKQEKGRERHSGFLCSCSGPLALAAALLPEKREWALKEVRRIGERGIADKREWNEVLYGRSGYIYTLLFLHRHIPSLDTVFPFVELLRDTVNVIFSASETNKPPYIWSWHGKRYLGAAHGAVGILTMIMKACKVLTERGVDASAVVRDTKLCVEWVMQEVVKSRGGWPPTLEDEEVDRLVHWCHGPPGAVLCLCTAYELYGDERFLDAAKVASEVVWRKGLLRKGVGLCHGISGNAYTFLHLYDVTKDSAFFDRAVHFAEFALDWQSLTNRGELRVPDRPFSLYEGVSGAAMLWNDLFRVANGECGGFPCFLDV